MKTAILTAALVILMTALSASAFDDTTASAFPSAQVFKVWVIQPDANIIKFRVDNPKEDKVVLKIYNDKKEKIFHRTVKKENKRSISCDMSNCGSGIYTCVVVRNGREEMRKLIILN